MLSSIEAKYFRATDWGLIAPVAGISVIEPSPEALAWVEENKLALTLWNAYGKAVAHLGIRSLGVRRAEVWAIIDHERTLREFAEIHRVAQERIDSWDVDRLEAFVECGFAAGHVWLRRLGFALEAPRMRRYLPDGKDCALYARVRDGGGQWESPSL